MQVGSELDKLDLETSSEIVYEDVKSVPEGKHNEELLQDTRTYLKEDLGVNLDSLRRPFQLCFYVRLSLDVEAGDANTEAPRWNNFFVSDVNYTMVCVLTISQTAKVDIDKSTIWDWNHIVSEQDD